MGKVLVEVYTPGNGNIYEFKLDNTLKVLDMKAKIIDEILELENGGITLEKDKTILLDYGTELALNENKTVRRVGVRSGHRLILI